MTRRCCPCFIALALLALPPHARPADMGTGVPATEAHAAHGDPAAGRPNRRPSHYSLEQALSPQAQLRTIAFSGLAFLTGDFASDTFLPPGKVSDYFGFQYLRDIDEAAAGHNSSFLTRIAFNVLAVLDDDQRRQLAELARRQQADVLRFAEMRLPLMLAFRAQLSQARVVDHDALLRQSRALYELDAAIALERAETMARIVRSLDERQRRQLGGLRFGDSGTWPAAAPPADRAQLSHELDVLVMTYASELFAWQAGNPDADTYFCPERHAMYFGGFGLKTAPAMGKQDYAISTSLTADVGARFLDLLSPAQRATLEQLPIAQQPLLREIVQVRRDIATELRGLLAGRTVRRDWVLERARRYGELDGELSDQDARAFAQVARGLTAAQRQAADALRERHPGDPAGPFLYSDPLPAARYPVRQAMEALLVPTRPGQAEGTP